MPQLRSIFWFCKLSGGVTPLEWIQQYVVTQAKLLMDAHPKQTIKETAYQLDFPTTANFCRYFRRATGIYPQAYKKDSISDQKVKKYQKICVFANFVVSLQPIYKKQSIMRNIQLPLLFFLMFACACPMFAQEIATATDLQAIATQCDADGCEGVTYELTADIDLTGVTWAPIGTSTAPFKGTLKGNGHLIKGLSTISTIEPEVGLFGVIAKEGKVEGLGIAGVRVFAKSKEAVGAIAGRCDGEISRCWNMTQMVVINCDKAGGIVGELQSDGKITDCYNSAYINSNVQTMVGGIAGNNAGTITRAFNIGYVKNGNAIVGGEASSASYDDCHFDRKLYYQTAGTYKEGVFAYDRTKEMFDIFADQTATWSRSTTRYPLLKAFESSAAAKVSVAPMFLDTMSLEPVNHANNITVDFTVSVEGGISWECQADSAKRWFEFNGSKVTVRRPCTERDALVDVSLSGNTRVVYFRPERLPDFIPGAWWNTTNPERPKEGFCYGQDEDLNDYISLQIDSAQQGWVYGNYHYMITRDSVTLDGDTVRWDTVATDIVGNEAFKEWLNTYKVPTNKVGTFVLRRWSHDEGCVSDWVCCRKEIDSKEMGKFVYEVYPPFDRGQIENGTDTIFLTSSGITVHVDNVREASGGGGAISYQWEQKVGDGDWEEMSGRTEKNSNSITIDATGTYSYRRAAMDDAHCFDDSNPYSIGVRTFVVWEKFDPGAIVKQTDLKFCEPNDAQALTLGEAEPASGGSGTYKYQWYRVSGTDTIAIDGATAKTLDLSSYPFAAGQDYIFVRKAEDNSRFTSLTRSRDEVSLHIISALTPGIISGNQVTANYCAPYDADGSTAVAVQIGEVEAATGDAGGQEYRWFREDGSSSEQVGTAKTLDTSFPLSELLGHTFTYYREVRNAGNDCEWKRSSGEFTQFYGQDQRTEIIKTICKEKLPFTMTKNGQEHTFTQNNETWLVEYNYGQCNEDTLYIIKTVDMPVFNIDSVAHVCQTTGVMTLYFEHTAGQSNLYRITYSDAMASVMGKKVETGTITVDGMIVIENMPAIGSGDNYLDLEIGYGDESVPAEDICYSDAKRLRLDFSLGGYLYTKYDRVLFVDNNPDNGVETGGESKLKFTAYQWYKNDSLLTGATGQYYHENGAVLNGTFYVMLTDTKGQKYRSCEITLPLGESSPAPQRTSVYPVPANGGEPITIEGVGTVQILSFYGERVSQIVAVEGRTTISAPAAPGIYYVQIIAPDGSMEMHKLIVK